MFQNVATKRHNKWFVSFRNVGLLLNNNNFSRIAYFICYYCYQEDSLSDPIGIDFDVLPAARNLLITINGLPKQVRHFYRQYSRCIVWQLNRKLVFGRIRIYSQRKGLPVLRNTDNSWRPRI